MMRNDIIVVLVFVGLLISGVIGYILYVNEQTSDTIIQLQNKIVYLEDKIDESNKIYYYSKKDYVCFGYSKYHYDYSYVEVPDIIELILDHLNLKIQVEQSRTTTSLVPKEDPQLTSIDPETARFISGWGKIHFYEVPETTKENNDATENRD